MRIVQRQVLEVLIGHVRAAFRQRAAPGRTAAFLNTVIQKIRPLAHQYRQIVAFHTTGTQSLLGKLKYGDRDSGR